MVAKIRRVFGSVGGVCVCLCDPIGLHDKSVVFYLISVGFQIVAATVVCSAEGPILNDTRRHSDPKNICQIAGNRI